MKEFNKFEISLINALNFDVNDINIMREQKRIWMQEWVDEIYNTCKKDNMITEEKYLEAKEIVNKYENGLLDKPLIIKSLPTDDEIHERSLSVSGIEAESVQTIAWCYHDKGAKWMKEEILKRGVLYDEK